MTAETKRSGGAGAMDGKATDGHSKPVPKRSHARSMAPRLMMLLAVIQAFCGTVFLVDILYESHLEFFNDEPIRRVEMIHLGMEVLAVILLYSGYVLAHREFLRLRAAKHGKDLLLESLRGQFDDVIQAQFSEWRLSRSECDIALLSLRGLRISEIAEVRATSPGTVKAQLHSIFRKSRLHTRTELLGYFMDELLDCAADRMPLPAT